jgi:murein DD-endopeptidase / murein LD-carboxypeptidase
MLILSKLCSNFAIYFLFFQVALTSFKCMKKDTFVLWIVHVCIIGFQVAKGQSVVQSDTIDSEVDTLEVQTVVPKIALSKVDSLVNYAYTFLGDKYRRGGTSSKGFDCSGYTMTVFKNFGIKLPHTSAGQGLVGVAVSKPNIKRGDLILFKGRNRRSALIGHVGIVISEKGEPVRFIHSSTSMGVRIDRLDYDYYKKRYVKTVRLPQLYK